MKLIDKYLLRSFLVPLAYCLAGFVLVFIIFDLFDNMQDFIEWKTPFPLVIRYNLLLVPSVLVYIVPISLMLANLYCLSSLTKNNELTAMRASGVSIFRLIWPFIVVGFLASLAVAIINETGGPKSAYWTDQFINAEKNKHHLDINVTHNLAFLNATRRRDWMIGIYNRETRTMNNITINQQREDGSIEWVIRARRGQWLDGQWWFSDVFKQEFHPNGHPKGGAVDLELSSLNPQRQVPMDELSETPDDFINEMKDAREHPEQFTSLELLDYINRNKNFSPDVIRRARTDLHNKLATPWISIIVTLLGIPFGVQTGRKGVLIGVMLALGLFFGFYAVSLFCVTLGKGGYLQPHLAAWLPNLGFFIFGAILVWRLR